MVVAMWVGSNLARHAHPPLHVNNQAPKMKIIKTHMLYIACLLQFLWSDDRIVKRRDWLKISTNFWLILLPDLQTQVSKLQKKNSGWVLEQNRGLLYEVI